MGDGQLERRDQEDERFCSEDGVAVNVSDEQPEATNPLLPERRRKVKMDREQTMRARRDWIHP